MHRFHSALAMSTFLLLGFSRGAAAQPISPPVQIPGSACTSNQLAASLVMGEGAAGTLFDTLALTNTGGFACTLDGFVSIQLLDAAGNPLPTIAVPGGGQLGGRPAPSAFALAPGAASQFVIAWSDVPVGSETTCPVSAAVQVTPPGASSPLTVSGLTGVAPCNSGTVDVSPLRAPGATVP